ncbi:PIG-L family deacetylase [Sphingobacterium oryzagri]|uniref:PIG-L family deacetylase n=1 Tax=Sphingobacterium oryzagri TaxID=3025669 RepID=A0ABY7WGZ2_9SPHI|nr:PIG-L family deacetylase [Sphingobacterium sp. KACC 22765]WDF68807.1 PIG-L family deacetylase [Sphingobacterium sp. KACC 22765]
MRRHYIGIFIASLFFNTTFAQAPASLSSSEVRLKIERLNVLGSVLYFAAHPDDENTKLIGYLAAERKVRTSYLSLTRGDGGQNLIGTEQGIELGLIRTQELLQARKIDGGEQYFASAYDFGFSKTYEETFRFWKKDDVLKEAVYIIRKLQPDVIITRFPPDERGGHGHHQASAILAHEAFIAAADPAIFPEQLKEVSVWQARRLLWNTASFMRMSGESQNQLKVDIGAFNPLLGKSYGEIAAESRSQHKSQGFGSASSNGKFIESFEYVTGEQAKNDLFDNVDLTWNRVAGSSAVQQAVNQLMTTFNDRAPENSLPQLANLWKALQQLPDGYWKNRKIKEVEDLALACAGIKIETISRLPRFVTGVAIPFQTEIIVRNPQVNVNVLQINKKKIDQILPTNEVVHLDAETAIAETSQPYWLVKPHSLGKFEVSQQYFGYPINPDLPQAQIDLDIAGIQLQIKQPITYRFVDPVRGEIHEFVEVVPALTASVDSRALLVPKGEKRNFVVDFQKNAKTVNEATITFGKLPKGWTTDTATFQLKFEPGQTIAQKTITITNESANEAASLTFLANGAALKDIHEIAYDHIPRQAWFPTTSVNIAPITLINPVKRIGYLMGAGDLLPEALRNLGSQVDLLSVNKLNRDILAQYDAIVCGIRLMNVEPRMDAILPALYAYVADGGVLLMQYNVNARLQVEQFAPKPFTLSRARVTEEDASVAFSDPNDPIWNYPNKITQADFDGWIQERGLYFAENIDKSYRTPLIMHDKKEAPHNGSLLIQKMGKGKFVYTGLSFFRQLPAGVPGASRLFVNLLAKEN